MVAYMLWICVAQVTGTWPMFGGDLAHHAYQDTRGAMSSTPVIKWQFPTGNTVHWQFAAIADLNQDGNMEVVMGSYDDSLYCINGLTGQRIWAFYAGGYVASSAAVGDVDNDGANEVVVGSRNDTVYCIDSTGNREWAFGTGGDVWSSPALVDIDADNNLEVIVGSWDGKMYCLDGGTGAMQWSYTPIAPGEIWSSPAVADVDGDASADIVFGITMSDTPGVYCLNSSGGLKWFFETNGGVVSSPSIADVDNDGQIEVIVGHDNKQVLCLNGTTGDTAGEWVFVPSESWGSFQSSQALYDIDNDGDLDVFTACMNGYMYGIDGGTGNQLWKNQLTTYNFNYPVSLADVDEDNMPEIMANADSSLYCLNAEDGSLLWVWRNPGDYISSPPFPGDIDNDDCVEIMVATNINSQSFFALEDPGDTSGCSQPVYYGTEEGYPAGSFRWEPRGGHVYLFVSHQTQVSLVLYDASGRLVQNLYDGLLRPGAHTFIPKLETKGVYLAVLRYPGGMKTLKITR